MPLKRGYVAIHRKITDHPLYFSEKFTKLQAWLDLIILANHKPSHYLVRGIKISVGRGQIAMSQETFAQRWRWTRGSVNRFFLYLKSEQQIVQQKTAVTNLITILNYNTYQPKGTTERAVKGTTDGTTLDTHSKNVLKNDNNRNGQGFKKPVLPYQKKQSNGPPLRRLE